MNNERQRELYEQQMGEEALRRQVIALWRGRGCTCSDELILANRLRGANAGHESGCALADREGW